MVATAFVVLAVVHSRGWTTESMRLADGRTFAVLNFDRHVSYIVERGGARRTERYFWVRYYATSRDPTAMLQEARTIAPALYRIADSLGFSLLQLSPSRPILFKRFPLGVVSAHIRFTRDSTGSWNELR